MNYFIQYYSKINGKKISAIHPVALKALIDYSWPGNIRELKNIIERMIVLSGENAVELQNVPDDIRNEEKKTQGFPSVPNSTSLQNQRLTDIERDFIRQKLEAAQGNKSLAAKMLGISRRTLYRKIDEYKL